MAILYRKLPELDMETSVRLKRETREKVVSEVREMYRKSSMTVSWDRFYQEHCEPVWGKYMKLEEEKRKQIIKEKIREEKERAERYASPNFMDGKDVMQEVYGWHMDMEYNLGLDFFNYMKKKYRLPRSNDATLLDYAKKTEDVPYNAEPNKYPDVQDLWEALWKYYDNFPLEDDATKQERLEYMRKAEEFIVDRLFPSGFVWGCMHIFIIALAVIIFALIAVYGVTVLFIPLLIISISFACLTGKG